MSSADDAATVAPEPGGPRLSKQEKLTREREILVSQLAAERLDTVRARVAFILNHYPDARNSDRVLVLTYWRKFQPDVLGPDEQLSEAKILQLENPMSLGRARAKIQNEFGLFRATEEIQSFRRERALEIREQVILDKPDRPLVEVFGDESGKNQTFALVGSLWTLDAHRAAQLLVKLLRFLRAKDIKHEFHFAELSRHKVDSTKAFFSEAMSMSDSFSFKAVAVRQTGMTRSVEDVYRELYYRLLMDGLNHEFITGRVSTPRIIHLWKDKDTTNDALDALGVARLKDDLSAGLAAKYAQGVTLEMVESVDSKANYLVQLADLFTGSVNRVLNSSGEARNYKDEVASFVLDTLGLKISADGSVETANQDSAAVIVL